MKLLSWYSQRWEDDIYECFIFNKEFSKFFSRIIKHRNNSQIQVRNHRIIICKLCYGVRMVFKNVFKNFCSDSFSI